MRGGLFTSQQALEHRARSGARLDRARGCSRTVREAARAARGRHAESACADQPLDRRAQASDAGTHQGGADRRADGLASYPATAGCRRCARRSPAGSRAATGCRRVDPATQVLPVNGSREALFAFAQTVDRPGTARRRSWSAPIRSIRSTKARRCSPARRRCTSTRRRRAISASTTRRCRTRLGRAQLLYVCSPGNPTGHVMTLDEWRQLFELSDRHGFVIASDECYSEIYFDEARPPLGALEAARPARAATAFRGLIVFSSLSKRSNVPGHALGLRRRRCGAAEGVPAVPHLPRQRDEPGGAGGERSPPGRTRRTCVDNRRLYRDKFAAALPLVGAPLDDGACRTAASTSGCARRSTMPRSPASCYAQYNVTVLPGQLPRPRGARRQSRPDHVRIALVAPPEECVEGVAADREFATGLEPAAEKTDAEHAGDHRRAWERPRQPRRRRRADAKSARRSRQSSPSSTRGELRVAEKIDGEWHHPPVDQEGGAAVVPPAGQPG